MKAQLFFLALILLPFAAIGQGETEMPVDTLSEIEYLYQGEPMPFPSGVAMSDKQYTFFLKSRIHEKRVTQIKKVLTPPKIVYEVKEVRKKGDGNRIVWAAIGALPTLILAVVLLK